MTFENKNTIVNFSNSLLKHFGAPTFHETIPEVDEALKGHNKVVVMLFDGLGSYIQNEHAKSCPFILSHFYHRMIATYPPTTVASTTGLLSAKFPIENGWLAWSNYFKDYGVGINVFNNHNHDDHGLVVSKNHNIQSHYFPYESIFELIRKHNHEVSVLDLKTSDIDIDGMKNLKDGREKMNHFLEGKGKAFGYFYFTSPDKDIHENRVHHKKVAKAIKKIDKTVQKIVRDNPDTLFFTIADHGLVDVIYLHVDEHPELMDTMKYPLTLEGRAAGFYIKEGREKEFEEIFAKLYGDSFTLMNRKEYLKAKVFGEGKPHERIDNFLPDYLAIATKDKTLSTTDHKHLLAHHAGYTKEELEINIGVYNK